ncbi:MAG: aliphatic sulfonate ABC transporter substrate-binding protein [bacterium]|nr:aliphatic sulfonate ABC transporter substrate-binding protein [bacterium]
MKRLILVVALVALLSVSFGASAQSEPTVIRIGHQRGDLFSLAIAQGWVDEVFPPEQYTVEFSLFPSGPPLLEALNAGAIDFGGTGDAPPVFAQAAGVPLRYVATQVAYGNEAVIVPADSEIDSLDDLAGQQIAYVRGSSANYLLVLALQAGGVAFEDVESVLLPPADANAAFQSGAVDAWVIWDPFLTVAQTQSNARVLAYASDLHNKRVYFSASEAFTESNPDLLPELVALLQRGVDWISENPTAYSAYLASETGIDAAVWDTAYSELGAPADITYLDSTIVAAQQQVADTFFELELIPQAIDVASAVWHPDGVIPEATPEATTAP